MSTGIDIPAKHANYDIRTMIGQKCS